MNESASSVRGPMDSSIPPEPPQSSEGSSTGRTFTAGSLSPSVGEDQRTVITQRGALPTDSRSDSVVRILHGQILPGERLGHFELLQYVGGGGMGKVFRALDTRLARSVALKILPPEHAADHETLMRFQNEAQSAARLDHDNIARVYYVGEDRGLHYIVFEFIEGVNVRDLVESKGPLSLAEAVSYALQVADALSHAAQRNIVHRDIKPSNLLITPGGQAKLIDMGLARLGEVDANAADLTASGVTLGTFDYISPEQARDPRNTDVRSDIYSLGCTLFFMLTGRPPFLGGTMLQKLLQHQADQPPDLRQFRPELPEEVNRILRKMLAKDPRHRYASPTELVNDLIWVARAAGLRSAAPGERIWTVPTPRAVPFLYQHLPWIVSLSALVVIVIALDYLWRFMPGPAGPLNAPAAIDTENGTPNVPSVAPPQTAPTVPAAAAAKHTAIPESEPILPELPSPEAPLQPLPGASATTPAMDAVLEKSHGEKPAIPAAQLPGDAARRSTPKNSGGKKAEVRPGQAVDRSLEPGRNWIGRSAASASIAGMR